MLSLLQHPNAGLPLDDIGKPPQKGLHGITSKLRSKVCRGEVGLVNRGMGWIWRSCQLSGCVQCRKYVSCWLHTCAKSKISLQNRNRKCIWVLEVDLWWKWKSLLALVNYILNFSSFVRCLKNIPLHQCLLSCLEILSKSMYSFLVIWWMEEPASCIQEAGPQQPRLPVSPRIPFGSQTGQRDFGRGRDLPSYESFRWRHVRKNIVLKVPKRDIQTRIENESNAGVAEIDLIWYFKTTFWTYKYNL